MPQQPRHQSWLISIHALLAESDRRPGGPWNKRPRFLSTLSLRRATVVCGCPRVDFGHFYPRSPCGERPAPQQENGQAATISIHALLAESDAALSGGTLSDVDFYPRSPCGERLQRGPWPHQRGHFYPRSPCGERQVDTLRFLAKMRISIHALLAESDNRGPASYFANP